MTISVVAGGPPVPVSAAGILTLTLVAGASGPLMAQLEVSFASGGSVAIPVSFSGPGSQQTVRVARPGDGAPGSTFGIAPIGASAGVLIPVANIFQGEVFSGTKIPVPGPPGAVYEPPLPPPPLPPFGSPVSSVAIRVMSQDGAPGGTALTFSVQPYGATS